MARRNDIPALRDAKKVPPQSAPFKAAAHTDAPADINIDGNINLFNLV